MKWTFQRKLFAGFGLFVILNLFILLMIASVVDQIARRLSVLHSDVLVPLQTVDAMQRDLDHVNAGTRTALSAKTPGAAETAASDVRAALQHFEAGLTRYDSENSAAHETDDFRALQAGATPEQAAREAEALRQIRASWATLKALVIRNLEAARPAPAEAVDAFGREARSLTEAIDEHTAWLAGLQLEEAGRLSRTNTAAVSTARTGLAGGVIGMTLFAMLTSWLLGRTLGDQVGGAVQGIQSSATELQSAANQQATAAREQATAMAEISTTIGELLATSRQIAESARRVTQIAHETATAATTGGRTVAGATESMSTIKRQVDAIVTNMLELGRKSQQIGGVVQIITELSDQTNILAINATIEAAGGGEAGRRFAVVADEIRRLADRVAGSTKEVRTLIDEIRAAVNTTVMTTEAGSKAVESGNRQFGEVTSGFTQISGLVRTTNEAVREIELSTKQQTSAVEQLNVAISSVVQAARETDAGAAQTLATASGLATLSRDLAALVRPGEDARR